MWRVPTTLSVPWIDTSRRADVRVRLRKASNQIREAVKIWRKGRSQLIWQFRVEDRKVLPNSVLLPDERVTNFHEHTDELFGHGKLLEESDMNILRHLSELR